MRRVDLKIQDIAFGGKGVARENGKAVFVPFTIEGESISAEIVREKKKFAEADVLVINEASPHRVTPECPYFGRCGGCSYQHITYEHQLAIKWRQVRDVLQRIGKLSDLPMRPIVPSPAFYAYRNRITIHVEEGVVGFFRRDSHRLIDVERCPIAMDEVNTVLRALRRNRPRDGHFNLRARPTGPRVFAQTNDAVASAMRDLVGQMIPEGQELLIDGYCGAGFFAKTLRHKFARIVGIDWDRFAIQEAQKEAGETETYIAGDIDLELKKAARSSDGRAMTIIVDPPATGLSETTRQIVSDLAPATFIYISCNPPTLARDLQHFAERFTLESVTPLDMFPQTAEIEVVIHLKARTK